MATLGKGEFCWKAIICRGYVALLGSNISLPKALLKMISFYRLVRCDRSLQGSFRGCKFVFMNAPKTGVIKLPILGGDQTMQMYGAFAGFPHNEFL